MMSGRGHGFFARVWRHRQLLRRLIEGDVAVRFGGAAVGKRLHKDAGLWARLSATGKFIGATNFAGALPISVFTEYCQDLAPRAVPVPAEGVDVAVSIIVPVYNQWRFTRACLNSILETCLGDDIVFEIILADDGSSDQTVDAAETYPGLRVAKTPTNIGFLRNCNNASRQARGRYLLLLNNDTIVLPGWLSSLYHTLERDSGRGDCRFEAALP